MRRDLIIFVGNVNLCPQPIMLVCTLKKQGVEDLLDFTVVMLQRLYTEPAKLQLAIDRGSWRFPSPSAV